MMLISKCYFLLRQAKIQLSTVSLKFLDYSMPSAMQSSHRKKGNMWKFSDEAEKKTGKITQPHAHLLCDIGHGFLKS